MLCHRAKVAKTFRCCDHRLCFLQCDWQREISLQKVIKVNEAKEISQMSPDPLFLGGVWGCDWCSGGSLPLIDQGTQGQYSGQAEVIIHEVS